MRSLIVILACLLLAGCASTPEPATTTTPAAKPATTSPAQPTPIASTPAQTTPVSTTPVATTPPPTTTTPAATGPAMTLDIHNFRFLPAQANATAGTPVQWKNADSAPHTATADDGSFDTGTLASGATSTPVTLAAGTYAYHCNIHPSMTGTLTVA